MSDYPPYDSGSSPYVPPAQYPEYPSEPYPPSQPYAYPSQEYAQPVYQTPGYAPQGYVMQPVMVDDPGSGQALAGMILGIAGMLFSFFGVVPLIGLIFSILGMKSVTRKGFAIAGLVMSIIGLVFALCTFAFLISALSQAGS